jgi:hypothetical protein
MKMVLLRTPARTLLENSHGRELRMCGRWLTMAVDPLSFLCGAGIGIVLCRCVFLVWREREDMEVPE